MTFGDFIEKCCIAFGGKPSAVVRCEKRIAEVDSKIKSIQEAYNRIFEENKILHEQIEEKTRLLAREVVQANKKMFQMQMSVLNKNFEQKTNLATFLMNQLTNLNTLRGSIEISLAQVRTGMSPVTLEMQLDEIDVVLEDAEEANTLGHALGGKTTISPTFTVEESSGSSGKNTVKNDTPTVQLERHGSVMAETEVSSDQTDVVVPQA